MPIDRRLHVQASLSHVFLSPRVQMYVKRFYREDGAERKREHRQRRATAELLSNFDHLPSDLIDDEDITDSSMNRRPAENDLLQLAAINNDHFDTSADQMIHQKSAIQKKLKKIVRTMAVTMMTTITSRSG